MGDRVICPHCSSWSPHCGTCGRYANEHEVRHPYKCQHIKCSRHFDPMKNFHPVATPDSLALKPLPDPGELNGVLDPLEGAQERLQRLIQEEIKKAYFTYSLMMSQLQQQNLELQEDCIRLRQEVDHLKEVVESYHDQHMPWCEEKNETIIVCSICWGFQCCQCDCGKHYRK